MDERALRTEVLALLDGGRARTTAEAVLDGFPVRRAGERPPGFAHSAWQLLEHLRIAQRDILSYCTDADYRHLDWPADYWPASPAPPNAAAWRRSARAFLTDLGTSAKLARSRRIDLLADLPHVTGVPWLRELFLVANHNSWHLGQLLQLRRALKALPAPAAARRPTGRRARR